MKDTQDMAAAGHGQSDHDRRPDGREQPDSIHNIFDTVFRTMMEYLPQLIIPVVNELFQTEYRMDEDCRLLKNEHMTGSGALITDLYFELGQTYYHVEVQSTPDGRMLIRVMEYAAAIAIEKAERKEDGSFRVRFPNSCAIYLRSTKNTPDKLTAHVEFPGDECICFNVPLLKVQEYTKEKIFQKNLLMLLPYYLMRYEKELGEIGKLSAEQQEEADHGMEVFLEEYRDICDRLLTVGEARQDYYLYTLLTEQIKTVAEYLTPGNEKERVINMGGTVIKPLAQIMLEQGMEQGMEQGIEQGIRVLILNCKDLGISYEDTAVRVRDGFQLSADRVRENMRRYWK